MSHATLPGLNRAARAGLGPNIIQVRRPGPEFPWARAGTRAGANVMVKNRAGLGNEQI